MAATRALSPEDQRLADSRWKHRYFHIFEEQELNILFEAVQLTVRRYYLSFSAADGRLVQHPDSPAMGEYSACLALVRRGTASDALAEYTAWREKNASGEQALSDVEMEALGDVLSTCIPAVEAVTALLCQNDVPWWFQCCRSQYIYWGLLYLIAPYFRWLCTPVPKRSPAAERYAAARMSVKTGSCFSGASPGTFNVQLTDLEMAAIDYLLATGIGKEALKAKMDHFVQKEFAHVMGDDWKGLTQHERHTRKNVFSFRAREGKSIRLDNLQKQQDALTAQLDTERKATESERVLRLAAEKIADEERRKRLTLEDEVKRLRNTFQTKAQVEERAPTRAKRDSPVPLPLPRGLGASTGAPPSRPPIAASPLSVAVIRQSCDIPPRQPPLLDVKTGLCVEEDGANKQKLPEIKASACTQLPKTA